MAVAEREGGGRRKGGGALQQRESKHGKGQSARHRSRLPENKAHPPTPATKRWGPTPYA